MINGHLYRYYHPFKPYICLYVGQGSQRDKCHRRGTTAFGAWFKKVFPEIDLSEPVRWNVIVSTQIELNEEETIAMFQYHTWCGMGGRNLTLPGLSDYKGLSGWGNNSRYSEKWGKEYDITMLVKKGRQQALAMGYHEYGNQGRRERATRYKLSHVDSNKLCECGCGKFTKISIFTNKKKGHVKGQPMKFISGHNNILHVVKRLEGEINEYAIA